MKIKTIKGMEYGIRISTVIVVHDVHYGDFSLMESISAVRNKLKEDGYEIVSRYEEYEHYRNITLPAKSKKSELSFGENGHLIGFRHLV